MSKLFHLRSEEKRALARELESWKPADVKSMMARDLKDLIDEMIADRRRDEEFLRRILEQCAGADKKKIDEANRFIQEYCGIVIRIHDLYRKMVRLVDRNGHHVGGADELAEATKDYLNGKKTILTCSPWHTYLSKQRFARNLPKR